MPIARSTRFALIAVSLSAFGSAGAEELRVMPPGFAPTAEVAIGGTARWIATLPEMPQTDIKDGLLFSVPVELASADCAEGARTTLLQLASTDADPSFASEDPRGLSRMALRYAPAEGVLSVEVTARPLVDGVRLPRPITYAFKILDRFAAPRAFCGRNPAAGAFRFNLYLNQDGLLVEAVPLTGGTSRVYLSPVNMGPGQYLWFQMLNYPRTIQISGDSGTEIERVVTRGNHVVRLTGLNWTAGNKTRYPYDPGRYNVKDALNYQYGAKAFPTASPTLRLPRAAAALLGQP